jgi:hypothetical protein
MTPRQAESQPPRFGNWVLDDGLKIIQLPQPTANGHCYGWQSGGMWGYF